MRALQKLVRNGNATQVTIPRPLLIAVGWLPGQQVILELLEDNSIRVRIPVSADFAPIGPPKLVFDTPGPVTR